MVTNRLGSCARRSVPILNQKCRLADSHACERVSQASLFFEGRGPAGRRWRCRYAGTGAARGRTVGRSHGRGGCKPGGKTTRSMPPCVPGPGHMLPSGRVSGCWPSPAPLAGSRWRRRTGRCTTRPGRAWARLGWDQVGRVAWDEQRHVLSLTGLAAAVPAYTVLCLAKAWDLPRWPSGVSAGPRCLTSGFHSTERPGHVWSPGACPAERVLGGWSSSIAGSVPQIPGVRAELESALTELRAVTGAGDAAGPALRIARP